MNNKFIYIYVSLLSETLDQYIKAHPKNLDVWIIFESNEFWKKYKTEKYEQPIQR